MELAAVAGLDRLGRARHTRKSSEGKEGLVKSGPLTDTVEISSKNTESRALLIEAVKARIKGGFYSRDAVADDVSDKLAKLFDR
jgi:hypothetical protein